MMNAQQRSFVVFIAVVALAYHTAVTSAQITGTTLPTSNTESTTEPADSADTTTIVETTTTTEPPPISGSKSTGSEVTQASPTESFTTTDASTESTTEHTTTSTEPPTHSGTSETSQSTVAPSVPPPNEENKQGARMTLEEGTVSPNMGVENEGSSSKVGGIVAGVMAAVVAAAAGYFAYYKKKFCFEPSDSEVGQSHGAKGAAQNDHQGATALLETHKEGGQ